MMTGKWVGAVLILAACAFFGFSVAAAYRREEQALRQLLSALDYMQCELQYRLTPLPDLCRMAAMECAGCIKAVLLSLSRELESQVSADVSGCMSTALNECKDLPARTGQALRLMGSSMGRFDMEGQVRGLEAVRSFCRRELEELSANRESRLRSYQTLGLCAGAALVILFI